MVKNIIFKLLAIIAASMSFFFVCREGMNILHAESGTLYDFDEIMTPVWEGDITYDESVLVVSEKDGNIKPIQLLYEIDEIVSVKSADYIKSYINGIDYELNNGKLIINKTGNIPILDYNEFHPTIGTAGFESRDGKYVLWKEGSYYHSKQKNRIIEFLKSLLML